MAFTQSNNGAAIYVNLRAPLSSEAAVESSLPSLLPPKYQPWYVSYSTRAQWKSARNVQLRLDAASKSQVEWSWQVLGSNEVKRSEISRSDVQGGWELLGSGKEGNLESWMIETEYGIEDSSGEIRADWRATWAVLYSPKGTNSPAGIDVLSGWDRTLKDETISQIKNALLCMEDEELKQLADELFVIKCEPDERPKTPKPGAPERDTTEERSQKESTHSCGWCVIM